MNQRVPDSSGLPLRAMVMVLLFLALAFLLLGLKAALSDGDSSNQSTAIATTTTTTTAKTTTTPAPAKGDVHIYNMSGVPNAAAERAAKLNPDHWNVTVGNFPPDHSAPSITADSVYYNPNKPGEKESADEVVVALGTGASEERPPELADLPEGVIVLVMGG